MLQVVMTALTVPKYFAAPGIAAAWSAICWRLGGGAARKLRRKLCAIGDWLNCAAAAGSLAFSAAITWP